MVKRTSSRRWPRVLEEAPLFVPRMPRSGRPFTVRMSNCGAFGWVSDENGYRYQSMHPDTGRRWPPFPPALLAIWRELAHYPHPPEACLINFYGPTAKMGLHQDRDENDFDAPVVSISLGNSCLFRVGGRKRNEGHPVLSAQLGRRCCPWRRRAARLSRRRSDLSGNIELAPGRWTDQSNAAPGYAQRRPQSSVPDANRVAR